MSDAGGAVSRVEVAGERPYAARIGPGAVEDLVGTVARRGRRVAVVHAPTGPVAALASDVAAALGDAGAVPLLLEVPDGERAKDASALTGLWGRLGQAGYTRDDLVVGVGGGSVTDLAGFLGATWLRGVETALVATSLLGVVDAAVGGKTGINTGEGKNLVGAFHPPVGVWCDPAWLAGQPEEDYRSGYGEILKCGFVADPEILDLVAQDPSVGTDPAAPVTGELIRRAVQVKADVVGADLRESGLREILNYGHTFGHAIEQVEGYTWRHGEAVSVGLVYVAELAREAGLLAADVAERHREALDAVGLPVGYRGDRWSDLRAAMGRDKKARGSSLRFVVLEGLARPTRLEGPDEALLERAYAAVSG